MRNVARYVKKLINPHDPSKMWGRQFDLNRKECVALEGFHLFVHPDDYIGASIVANHIYEPHVTTVIRKKLHPGDVFLDIGANLGYFTMLASSIVGPSGKVIAFEPNPQNLQLIYESQIYNSFSNQTIYPYAVSDQAGILKFTTVGSNGGVVTKNSADQRHYLFVQSLVIDDLLVDQPVHLLKMDIEAHEPMALRGMEKFLRKQRPRIVTEFHPWAMKLNNTEDPLDYLVHLETLGYKIGVITLDGVDFMSANQVLACWKNLNAEQIHLDLYCEPI